MNVNWWPLFSSIWRMPPIWISKICSRLALSLYVWIERILRHLCRRRASKEIAFWCFWISFLNAWSVDCLVRKRLQWNRSEFRVTAGSLLRKRKKKKVYRTGGQEKGISRGTRGINLRGCLAGLASLAMNPTSDVRYTKIDRYIYKDQFNVVSLLLMYLLSWTFFRLYI